MRTIAGIKYVEPGYSPGAVQANLRVGFCDVAKLAFMRVVVRRLEMLWETPLMCFRKGINVTIWKWWRGRQDVEDTALLGM